MQNWVKILILAVLLLGCTEKKPQQPVCDVGKDFPVRPLEVTVAQGSDNIEDFCVYGTKNLSVTECIDPQGKKNTPFQLITKDAKDAQGNTLLTVDIKTAPLPPEKRGIYVCTIQAGENVAQVTFDINTAYVKSHPLWTSNI